LSFQTVCKAVRVRVDGGGGVLVLSLIVERLYHRDHDIYGCLLCCMWIKRYTHEMLLLFFFLLLLATQAVSALRVITARTGTSQHACPWTCPQIFALQWCNPCMLLQVLRATGDYLHSIGCRTDWRHDWQT